MIQKIAIPTQSNPTQQADVTRSHATSSLLVILLPIVVVCAIASYRKYKATVLQRQTQRLNRMWQLDFNKKVS